jgi:hypothetical protein
VSPAPAQGLEDVSEVVPAEVADERTDAAGPGIEEPCEAPSSVGVEPVEERRADGLLVAPKSDWYCSFGISSMRRRRSSPPSSAYAARSRART